MNSKDICTYCGKEGTDNTKPKTNIPIHDKCYLMNYLGVKYPFNKEITHK